MNKTELIAFVAKQTGTTVASAAASVEAVFSGITNSLKSGDKVSIIGWGAFEVTQTKPRIGRNPKTGEEIKIPARRQPKFKAGKELKEAVNG